MTRELILASTSEIRRQLLAQVGIPFRSEAARIDEVAIRAALLAEDATPRDVADALAEFKARRVAEKNPASLVIGCDQVLEISGQILSKPDTRDAAADQIRQLRGKTHRLLSAVVIYEDAEPVWRFVGQVRLTMRPVSDPYLEGYLDRNWPDVSDSVGGYKLEKEGARLFSQVQGDYFTVLGLPLLELCAYLTNRGVIDG